MDEPYFSSRSLLIAAGATALCCLCAGWVLRKPARRRRKSCVCACSCTDAAAGGTGGERSMAVGDRKLAEVAERQAGGSMMEQLVPEITTHALSYLDYTSLCRLSMTNSAMRRAANDDGAWKALYHKDFNVEQDTITPTNGWKAYYATTKAIINLNAEFYNIVKEKSLPDMSRIWLNADYVKCIHGSGDLFTGYNAVMDGWELAFNWDQGGWQEVGFQVQKVRARILGSMAWVTMDAYLDLGLGVLHITNVFELHHGQWHIVHHHSSATFPDAGPHNIFI